ncbi:MAG: hypothetical protein JXR36_13000 [Bacteroidales bacterium]|nr:hypothetical protein [Bacteroidales bacterium]
MELNLRDMRMLSNLTDNQLDEIEIHGLFKDDKVRTCRFIPTRSTPLTISEVVALVTGNFPEHKNKRHNRKTDYKINWDVVEKRKLLHDFSIGALSAVPLEKVDQLPKFHKHFPVHLIQRLSEMSDTQYNNIFERKLIWNPYLNTERFGHDWVKNKEFVHNPEKINIHKSCFGYDKKTKRTERFKESALGYDFWNQIFWLARLSPENWRKVEQYNLLMFSASDMATYMNLSDGTLQKVSDKAMFRHVHYAFKKNIWNVTFRIDILDDMAARKYGKIYKDISHYKKAPELITKVNGLTMGWGSNSDDAVKKELGVNFIPKDECFKIIASFGINWTEAMPELSLTKQYRKIAASYHPDLASKDKQDEYKEKFGTLALAVNTLKKYIEIQNKQKR